MANMLVAWKHEHTLGYELIDTGHRMVVDAINRLSGWDTDCIDMSDMLDMLGSQFERQFHHEEALMMVSRSKHLDEHRREHRRMLDTLAHLRQSVAAGQPTDGLLLMNLAAFLHSHLRGSDLEEFSAEPMRRVA